MTMLGGLFIPLRTFFSSCTHHRKPTGSSTLRAETHALELLLLELELWPGLPSSLDPAPAYSGCGKYGAHTPGPYSSLLLTLLVGKAH